MTREQWRVFGVTGTVHLVAISGLHVTLFAWLATGIARRLWRLARLGGRVPREPFAAAVGVFAAAVYALLAGFSVPTQRTLVMLGTWWLARLCGRPQGGLEVIGVALLAVLLFDPLAPLAAGFWLSFAAIAVLIATPSPAGVQLIDPAAQGMPSCIQQSLPWTLRPLRWTLQALHELVATQWRVTVALAPATLLLFGSVPVAGMLANLFAIPFFSFLLVPLILVALALWPMLPSGAVVLWRVAEWLYLQSWPLLEAIAALPGALWSVQPELAWLPVGLLALPLVLLPVPVALRVTVLVALVPLLTPARIAVPAGEFLAVLLETGDGVALAVLTQRHALVYDTGDVYGSTGARAQRQLLPALQALGRRQVDLVVQSRANGFRVTGVAALLDALPVRELRSGGRWNAGPSLLRACDQAAGWIWDNVEVRLFPGAPDGAEEAAGASCVLRVAARGGLGAALLVPAQVDRGEAGLLAAGLKRQRLQAEVVLAPRGGAVNATVPAFVAAVGAQQVLVASREMAHERLERIAAQWSVSRSQVWATARDGALLIGSTPAGRGIEVSRLVALQPRWVWRVPRD